MSLELLKNVSIYFLAQKLAAQTFQRTVGGMPFLSRLGGWLPFILVYPAFALVSKLWLSERRNMCVLQVLLQHSPMQLPKEIPRGAL